MADEFVHIHTHSEYSLLDGLGRIKDLVKEAKKLGQPALALTDHGAMHGAIEFFRACKGAEIKPIIGVETYQTLWGRAKEGRDPQFDKENYHLLLIAQNMTGYRNLLKLVSESNMRGFYYKPRIDHALLEAHADGLICTTGCLGAEVPQLLMQGKEKEAYERLGWYVDLFGKDRFFIELQEHSIDELKEVNKILVPWADKFGLQLLVTNDVHYVREQDSTPHEVLLCVQTGARMQDEKRMRLSDQSYFLKSRAQMEATFRPLVDLPSSAFDSSLRIAEMCEVDLEDPTYHLPDLPIPEGFTYATYLRHLTEQGLERLYGERAHDPDVQERKERELRIIGEMGFDVYFLIVADLCDFARSRNIWWNVRGSGAGSLVAYCTGITGLDPLKNNLIFERFLNPGRVTMPDFDLDYPDDQREEMIRYTVEKYGSDQVAQIVTFGRMKARAAIRDVGRAKDVPLDQVDRLAKLIPAIPGKPVTIQDVLTEGHEFYNPELVELYKKEGWVRDLLDTSMQLEGVARHSGIHAAAVIVADRKLDHYTPLMRGSKSTITETITQYEFPILESIGLLKVDFLGLSTLTVLREACRLIQEQHGIEWRLDSIPFEGEEAVEAFKLLSSGEVSGVFQVESQGMRRVLTEMRPSTFEHIVATISLYRPGPLEYIPNFIRRMHGDEEIEYKHPSLESILGETYGICVSGDAMITEARSGQRYRLDEIGKLDEFYVQGVDDHWQPAVGRVTHWIDSGIKPVFRLTLRNGASLKVTEDHRLLTEEGWRPLNELRAGDYVATPPYLFGPQETPHPMDRRKLRVLAYLLADGSLASMAATDFVSKDENLLVEYQRCLAAFDDVRPSFTAQIRGVTRVGAAKSSKEAHYHEPNALLRWLRDLGLKHPAGQRPGGLRSHEKYVPDFVFELGKEDIAFFLASLWECDGYIDNRLCHYKTVSPRLAEDVQTLLLRLGIHSVTYQADYATGAQKEKLRTGYQVTLYDTAKFAALLQPHMVSVKREKRCTRQSSTTIARAPFLAEVEQVRTLSYRGLMQAYGIDRQHFYPRGRNRQRIYSHVIAPLTTALALPQTAKKLHVAWEEITSIEYVGPEHVYDLTVEGLHSFVADNIVVHNCVYQEQIIQILSNLAGYTPGEADLVRRAIGKKKASEIERHKQIFVKGCGKGGIPAPTATAIYEDIEFFARYGFNKCLPGDVEVIDATTGRLVRVEDLYTGAAQIEATVTCDTADLRLRPGRVSAVMDNGIKPVYRLTTRLGRQIEATANHPFYTFDGWRLLEEMTPGTQIATPRRLPVEGRQRWPEHEIIALGHLLAEGNLCHPHSVYFYSQDWAQVEDYVAAAEQFENVCCSVAKHKETFSIYAKRVDRHSEPGIVRWAKQIGIWGKNAHTKEIPAAIFGLTNAQIGLLLSRMWEGDGHINVAGRSLYYATASERMARQMQHLLLRLGIVSRLRTVIFPYKEGRTGYQLFITGNENIRAFAAQIGIHFVSAQRQEKLAQLQIELLAANGTRDVVPLGVKELVCAATISNTSGMERGSSGSEQISTDFISFDLLNPVDPRSISAELERPSRYADNDIYWDEVDAIEYVGEKQTYDLEIPGTHNFVANDILVHNSHAADYAVITVQTAYLKAHYPVEYMAALLLVERDKTEKVINFINECRRMGIQVLPPDVNYSGMDFESQAVPAEMAHKALTKDPSLSYNFPVPPGAAIRFGMAAVKNVGEGPVSVILAERKKGGAFRTLEDFCDRVDLRHVNKRSLECLIKVGALDRFGHRSQLLQVLDQMVARSAAAHSAKDSGQISMFDLLGDAGEPQEVPIVLPKIEEVKSRERLQWEKELLGVFASSHPLQQLKIDLMEIVTCSCAELNETHDEKVVTVGGMIADIRTTITKKGDKMAFLRIEDMLGQCEVVLFPRTYEQYKDQLEPDRVILVVGKAQARNGRTSVLAEEIKTSLEIAREVVGVEENRYQEKLLDMPTFNGRSTAKSTAAPWDPGMDGYDHDSAPVMDEESPFANDMPQWLPDEEEEKAKGKNQKAKVVEEPVPVVAFVKSAEGEKAKDSTTIAVGNQKAKVTEEPAPALSSVELAKPAAEEPETKEPPSAPKAAEPKQDKTSSAPNEKETSSSDSRTTHAHGAPAPRNGHKATNGHSELNGQARARRTLKIIFSRCGQLDRDKYRLREIVDAVRDPRGRDQFQIIMEADGRRHQLSFPNDFCTVNERLLGDLQKYFNVDVTVEE